MLGFGLWAGLAKVVGPTITRAVGRAVFLGIKYKPELLMGARIAATAAGTVAACKAAVTAKGLLEQYEREEQSIRTAAAIIREKQELYKKVQQNEPDKLEERSKERDEHGHPVIISPNEYTEQNLRQELMQLKFGLYKSMAKKFALSIGLFGMALVFDVIGYRTYKNMIAGLAMTCSSLQQIVKAQQAKIERLTSGQAEQQASPVEASVTDENGNEVSVPANTVELEDISAPFELFFGEGSPNWSRDAVYNKRFLSDIQRDANDLLALRGFVTMNDIGRMLDKEFVPRRSWYAWGWANKAMSYDEIKAGKNYRIDLGIDDPVNEGKTEFILRPNCDGFILAEIPEDEGLHEADQRKGLFSNLNGKLDLRSLVRR